MRLFNWITVVLLFLVLIGTGTNLYFDSQYRNNQTLKYDEIKKKLTSIESSHKDIMEDQEVINKKLNKIFQSVENIENAEWYWTVEWYE